MTQVPKTLEEIVGTYPYPGRGLVVGATLGGEAYWAYWLTGRSPESKARRASLEATSIVIEGSTSARHDPLRHYTGVRKWKRGLVLGNGEQVDFVTNGLESGQKFMDLLQQLEPEPDPPIMTPRIVAVADATGAEWGHVLLGAARLNQDGSGRTERMSEDHEQVAPGQALVLHTYAYDGVDVRTDAVVRRAGYIGTKDDLGEVLWTALDSSFRVLLIVGDPDLEHVIVHDHSPAR